MAVSTIRFTGLSSGLDTESLVKAMMITQQNKIDKQTRKQQLYNWKQEAWKEMNNKINTFNEKYIDKLKMQSTFIKNKITTSNDNAISVSENSNIGNGVHKVQINQLATSAYMTTKKANAQVKAIEEGTKLSELGITEVTKISVDGKELELQPTETLKDLKDKLSKENIELSLDKNQISLKSNAADSIEIKVVSGDAKLLNKLGVSKSDAVTLEAGKTQKGTQIRTTSISGSTTLGTLLDSSGKPIVSGELEITVNNKTVKLSPTDTIDNMIKKMKKADTNLAINFDSSNKQFFVSSTITGKDSKTQINASSDDANKLLEALGIVHQGDSALTEGKNALYTYNGMSFESESNNVKVNGLEMTLKEVTNGEITIQGTPNTDELVSFMKEFVSEYNKLMEEINTKLTTKTKSGYEPLTDEEKEATSEANVEKIEQHIKDGLFYRDSDLMTLRDSLRDSISGVVQGNDTYKTLHSIGITTGNWRENGKLYFDEETFLKAFQDKPDEVMNLFAGTGNSAEAVKQYMKDNNITDEAVAKNEYNALSSQDKQKYLSSSQGIFYQVSNNLKTLSKSSDYRTFGSYYNDKMITEQLKVTAEKITLLNTQYTRQENALYKKFTAMEKVMSQLNSQQASLASMLMQ